MAEGAKPIPEMLEKQKLEIEAQKQKELQCDWHECSWLILASSPPQRKCKKCWAYFR